MTQTADGVSLTDLPIVDGMRSCYAIMRGRIHRLTLFWAYGEEERDWFAGVETLNDDGFSVPLSEAYADRAKLVATR